MPQDTNYCVTQFYGQDWRTVKIKGWKRTLCFEYWTNTNKIVAGVLVLGWFMMWIAVLHMYLPKNNHTKQKKRMILHEKIDSDDISLDNIQVTASRRLNGLLQRHRH